MQYARREFMRLSGAALVAGAAAGADDRMPAQTTAAGDAALLRRLSTPYKYPELVLAPSFRRGEYDALGIDAPFVFRHKRRYYMIHIGFDGVGYRTGLASSRDLLHWEKEGLLVDRGPEGSATEFNVALTWVIRENELFGDGKLKKCDGRFVGAYHAYPRPGYEAGPAVIGLASSSGLRDWKLREPCLRASDPDAGEWERGGLYKSCLLEHDGTYYMFYNAKTVGVPWIEQIGVATSSNLSNWARYDGNPVVSVGSKGAFDDVFCSDPCVVRCEETWVMFFYTLSSDGRARESVAFSEDLLHWRKSDTVLVDVGPPGSIDAKYAHKPAVFAADGRLYHFYCAVAPAPAKPVGDVEVGEVRGIALAVS